MVPSGFWLRPLNLAVLSWLAMSTSALQVTPGSGCASFCLDSPNGDPLNANASSTTSTDIVCNNVDYYSTLSGSKFRTCLNCLQNSTAVNGTENDVSWYLYNLRYAVDVCLFSYPSKDLANTSISSPCALADNCRPLHTFLEADSLDPEGDTQLDYCSASGTSFTGTQLDNCIQCLQADSSQFYLANFLTALSAGCEQKPPTGELLGLNGSLFSTTQLGIVNPAWNQTTPAAAKSTSTITTGTIVGVAFAGVLVVASGIILFVVYRRRQKRQGERVFGFSPHDSHPPATKSITSSFTGSLPIFTTDYKHSRNGSGIQMFDHPTTQHITVPSKGTSEGSTRDETPLFGYENFISPRRKTTVVNTQATSSNPPPSDTFSLGQSLDEMPIHPAYVPHSIARPSRGTIGEPPATLNSAPDSLFSIQRYLETDDNTDEMPATVFGTSQHALEVKPVAAASVSASENSLNASSLPQPPLQRFSMLSSMPPPPPGLPPAGEFSMPTVPQPVRSKGRKPVPPPLIITTNTWGATRRLS